MKSEIEQQDIDNIALRVFQLIKPLLSDTKGNLGGDAIFTVDTLAKYLEVDPSWIYKQVSFKAIPYFKSGKYIRFRKKEIERWIDSRLVNPIPSLKNKG